MADGENPHYALAVDDGECGTGVVSISDLSALSVFIATLERPFMERLSKRARRGYKIFREVGCVGCHKPLLTTERDELPLRFPEVAAEPFANVFYEVDLTQGPAHFDRKKKGGLLVPLFADLKRHDMGAGLKEDFALVSEQRNREFTTARLWGIADSAPYLHDGRATTLTDAILAHGGEAQIVRDAFADLPDTGKKNLLAFLRSLRTPKNPARDLTRKGRRKQR